MTGSVGRSACYTAVSWCGCSRPNMITNDKITGHPQRFCGNTEFSCRCERAVINVVCRMSSEACVVNTSSRSRFTRHIHCALPANCLTHYPLYGKMSKVIKPSEIFKYQIVVFYYFYYFLFFLSLPVSGE